MNPRIDQLLEFCSKYIPIFRRYLGGELHEAVAATQMLALRLEYKVESLNAAKEELIKLRDDILATKGWPKKDTNDNEI